MEYEIAQDGEQLVVTLAGEVDVASADELAWVLQEAELRSLDVVLDLQKVAFLDSTALGAVVGSTRRLRDRGGDLKLIVTNPHVLRVLRITNLDSLIVVLDNSANFVES